MEKESEKITPYSFKTFGDQDGFKNVYKLKPLDGLDYKEKEEKIIFQENLSKKGGLEVFPFVQEQRERKEILSKINEEKYEQEISNRLKKIEKEHIEKAYQEGLKIAKEEVAKEFQNGVEKKIESINEMLRNALNLREEIYKTQKDQILFLIKSLTEWVILRELKDDGKYLEKLLEKLFSEVQTKQNFAIQVSQKDFESMPEVMEILQKKMGEFKNSRVIIDYDLPERGVVIDSENGIVKSTLEGQFAVLDEIFGNILPLNKEIKNGTGEK